MDRLVSMLRAAGDPTRLRLLLLLRQAELTVSELSAELKRTVEENFSYVRLRGEVMNYRGPHSSGHVYFCLKDAGARIDAIIWKGNFSRLKFKPEEGLEVVVTGKVTTYPGKSTYQIVIDNLEPAGADRGACRQGQGRAFAQHPSPTGGGGREGARQGEPGPDRPGHPARRPEPLQPRPGPGGAPRRRADQGPDRRRRRRNPLDGSGRGL